MGIFSLLLQYGLTGIFAGVLVTYCIGSLISGKFLTVFPINWYRFILLATTVFAFAVFFEIVVNHIYQMFFSQPLWLYQVYPSHGGSTSVLGMFFWPLYGVYLYFLYQAMESRGWTTPSRWKQGLLTGLDGPAMEIIINSFFLLVHHTFFFFYFPSDLFHFTTIQIIPIYALCGIVLSYSIHFMEMLRKNWMIPVFLYGFGVYVVAFL